MDQSICHFCIIVFLFTSFHILLLQLYQAVLVVTLHFVRLIHEHVFAQSTASMKSAAHKINFTTSKTALWGQLQQLRNRPPLSDITKQHLSSRIESQRNHSVSQCTLMAICSSKKWFDLIENIVGRGGADITISPCKVIAECPQTQTTSLQGRCQSRCKAARDAKKFRFGIEENYEAYLPGE